MEFLSAHYPTTDDPIVLAHARALLTGTAGTTSYVDADLRDTDKVLTHAAAHLDFGRPVAIILLGILQLIPDSDDPHAIVDRLIDVAAPGSHLVVSHPTADIDTEAMTEMARRLNARSAPAQMTLRTHAQISRFFDRLEVLEPGLVPVNRWRADDRAPAVPNFCAVARKP